MLTRYKYYPMFFPLGTFVSVQWFPAIGRHGEYSHGWPLEYDDVNAVYDLAQLAAIDLLNRLRKCKCGAWMLVRFSHQRFCSVVCREKEFRSSPRWREYRRQKAREYYRLHKSGKVK